VKNIASPLPSGQRHAVADHRGRRRRKIPPVAQCGPRPECRPLAKSKAKTKADVLVVDPPWPMKKFVMKIHGNEKPELDYKTMSLEDIARLNLVERFAGENCHVFLWTTNRFLPAALEILKTWGVKYSLPFIWHKNGGPQPVGQAQYNSELCIYGRVGKPKFVTTKNFFTCFNAKRTGHSKKPEEFYEMLRRVTSGYRIDCYNRRKISGFDVWGDQAVE
jgi:N6-adenosine-specific RNA methylase IME4